MPFQLIIRKAHEHTLEEFFSRGKVLGVDTLPFRLAGQGGNKADAVVPLLGSAVLDFSAGSDDGVELKITSLDGKAPASRRLRHGDTVEIGDVVLHFYLLRERPAVSWRANALGTLAMAGVVVALLLEAVAFCAVPYLMNHSNRWRRQGELQAINYQTDAIRKNLRKMDSSDPVTTAFLEALLAELDERARFLRRYGEAMSDESRQEMLENLRRLETLSGRLADSPQFLLPSIELQVDGPVKRIINTQ